MATAVHPTYPLLFSESQIRSTPIANRVVFAPTCPTWVADPYEGIFTDQAVAYYEERARGGCGLIIIGGTIIHPEALYSEFNFPGPVEGRSDRRARSSWRRRCIGTAASSRASCCIRACARCPCSRRTPRTTSTPSGTWSRRVRSHRASTRTPRCRRSSRSTRSRISSSAYADAARRAVEAGLDGVEYHMSHGYLPWQFLSPFYNHRSDGWGGSYEKRLRFPIESMNLVREAIGTTPSSAIASTPPRSGRATSSGDVKRIVVDLDQRSTSITSTSPRASTIPTSTPR